MANDSNLSKPSEKAVDEKDAVRQHHRLALGEKTDGQANPNGGAPTKASRSGSSW